MKSLPSCRVFLTAPGAAADGTSMLDIHGAGGVLAGTCDRWLQVTRSAWRTAGWPSTSTSPEPVWKYAMPCVA
jgi:hypothetical protein